MHPGLLTRLQHIVGEEGVTSDPARIRHLSRDEHWFSPVLEQVLAGHVADVVVAPASLDALRAVIECCVAEGIPITPRGAGTGNHGQAVPLQGGVLLSMERLSRVLAVSRQAVRVQAGARLGDVERAVRPLGLELRLFPTTYLRATVGGFVAGGFAGVGAVRWGTLWDGNVVEATVVTAERAAHTITLRGDALLSVIHAYGTTGILVDVTLALATAIDWHPYVVVFPSLVQAVEAARALATEASLPKRLLSVYEWPIPRFFVPLAEHGGVAEGQASVHVLLAPDHQASLAACAAAHGGRVLWHGRPEGPLRLSDYSFNHTTLWAKRADPALTYLLATFDPARVMEQILELKTRFGSEVLIHLEYIRSAWWSQRFRAARAELPQAVPLVRFSTIDRLHEVIDHCEALGIHVANPHTYRLDSGPRWNGAPILAAKRAWDPLGVLNPGKLPLLASNAPPSRRDPPSSLQE